MQTNFLIQTQMILKFGPGSRLYSKHLNAAPYYYILRTFDVLQVAKNIINFSDKNEF